MVICVLGSEGEENGYINKYSEKYWAVWNIFSLYSWMFLSKLKDINYYTPPGFSSPLIIWWMCLGTDIGYVTLFLFLFLGNELPAGSKAKVLIWFEEWDLGVWKDLQWSRAASIGGWFPYSFLDSFGFFIMALLLALLSLGRKKSAF